MAGKQSTDAARERQTQTTYTIRPLRWLEDDWGACGATGAGIFYCIVDAGPKDGWLVHRYHSGRESGRRLTARGFKDRSDAKAWACAHHAKSLRRHLKPVQKGACCGR